MGIYRDRTEFINQSYPKASEEEKRLLGNGFIPDSLKKQYEEFMQGKETGSDDDLDRISSANYFAINPEKVGGKTVPGSGFLNPVLVKGNLQTGLDAINKTLGEKGKTVTDTFSEISKENSELRKQFNDLPIGTKINSTLKDYKQTYTLTEIEGYKFFIGDKDGKPFSDGGKTLSAETIMRNYGSEIRKQDKIGDTKTEKTETMEKQNPKGEVKPEIKISKKDLRVIKAEGLQHDNKTDKKYQTVSETIKQYNPNLSQDEIKAWVYHKRKFGNPMKGWEAYFIAGGSGGNVLLQTTKDTTVKDNKYTDLRAIPANTIIGAKTKFKNTYGTETLVICKTPQGELLWVNIADVKEVRNNTGESQSEIDRLAKKYALIFDGTEYYPYPVYLFGNIYEKINTLNENKEAIVNAYGEEFFTTQLAKVSEYKPKQKSFRDPVRSNRPHILSLSEFANDPAIFGVKELNEETGIKLGDVKRGRFVEVEDKISLFDAFKYWFEEFTKDTELKSTTKDNIRKYYFAKAVKWPKDEDGKDILTNAQKEELIGHARLEAERLFSEFLSTALLLEDAIALDVIWNEKYNAYTNVVQFVDKVPIGFEGSTMFKDGQLDVKPAQRQGLAYLQLTGSGCLAYDVGFGKTLTGVLNIAQLLSQGLIKRPVVVVPKPTYKNWLRELFGYWKKGDKIEFQQFEGAKYFYGVFSGSNIKVNDWYNLSGSHYQKLLEKNGGDINKLVPENTITVLSYKGFEQMGFSRDISNEMFDSIARVIMQKEAHEAEKQSAKEAASFYQKVQGLLGLGNKNAIITVDKCGFDHITVDEAHNFKNVFASCGKDPSTGRKLFNISATPSTRAMKMFFITNYIQAKHGKRVTLLTATPFTNSPLEMYSMLSFIGLETLNFYNLYNIKKFFEQFILETIEYAVDAKGEISTKPVIKSFQNVKLLQTILYNHFHYKDNPKEAGVIRPCRIDLPSKAITTYLDMNEWQRKNQELIKSVAKSVSRQDPGAMLRAMNFSLNNAFSPFLYDRSVQPTSAKDFVNNSPKIKYAAECIKTVKEWHEQRGEECSGIILYSNRGKEFFEHIQDYLIDVLKFKRKVVYDDETLSEVEIISGGGGESDEDRKELIKDAFNAGVVKVIIGTGTIREGINLQSRSALTIDLYPEWNPTDITQLKGRNWRQGNMYGYVRFVMPLVINSMDNFINQKLDEKSKRIANIWAPMGDESNVIENEMELDPEQIKMALVDDANEKFKMQHNQAREEIKKQLDILEENKETIADIGYNIEELKKSEQRMYDGFLEDKNTWTSYVAYLNKLDLKKLKEDGVASKTINGIELALKNTQELIEAMNKYSTTRPHIPDLLEVSRMLKSRTYTVFTDMSGTGRKIGNDIQQIIGWGDSSFRVDKWNYDRLVGAYSKVVKAQKSVLNAYKKSWHDDISDIKEDIEKKIEQVKLSEEGIESEEYKRNMIDGIQREMDAAKALRGDMEEQVRKFASLNHLLSYLSDDTDKENCPIPEKACCENIGIKVIHADKEIIEPIGTVSAESDEMDLNSPEIQTMLADAIKDITDALPELKGQDKKEAKEALEICKGLLKDAKKMFWGGPVKQSKSWLVVYTRSSGKKSDIELSGTELQSEADVDRALTRRSDLGIYKVNSITELKRNGGPVSSSERKRIDEIAKFTQENRRDKNLNRIVADKFNGEVVNTGGGFLVTLIRINDNNVVGVNDEFVMLYKNENGKGMDSYDIFDQGIDEDNYEEILDLTREKDLDAYLRKGGPVSSAMDKLEYYEPTFTFEDYEVDKDRSRDGEGTDIWIEYKGLSPETMEDFNKDPEGEKYGKHFKAWAEQNGLYYTNLLSTDDGITFVVTVDSELKKGGPIRPKFAANKDHKYYNPSQDHERRYAKMHGRRKLRYHLEKGGPVTGYIDLSKEKPMVINDPEINSLPQVDLVKTGVITFEGTKKVSNSNHSVEALKQFWDYSQVDIAEHLNVLLLNQNNVVIGFYHHSRGGINATMSDPELICAVAVKSLAKGVIVAHNHPSGNLNPSENDILMTKNLKKALDLFGIRLLDSLIIMPNGGYTSLADEGQMRKGGPIGLNDLISDTEINGEYDQNWQLHNTRTSYVLKYNDRKDGTVKYKVISVEKSPYDALQKRYELESKGEGHNLKVHWEPFTNELSQGILVEAEHRETLEKLSRGEITVEQAIEETAKVHLQEDPNYYSKLSQMEGEMRTGGPVRPKFASKKDHKYYNPAQRHEQQYAKAHDRVKKRYKK